MHRVVFGVLVSMFLVATVACAAGHYKMASAPMGVTGGAVAPGNSGSGAIGEGSTMAIPEQLVIEGSLTVQVEEIGDLLPSLHALVDGAGGRIITEVVSGAETSWSAQLKLRVPPNKVDEIVAFLAKRGEVLDKRINATDVSKTMFDQELAIKNRRTTLDRLTKVMETPNLTVTQILEIEKEMTRVRGEIDQLEGDQRFLKDRVGLATLDVSLGRREGAVTIAEAKFYPGARFSMLTLFDANHRARNRVGGGFVIHSVLRTMSIEVDVFQKELASTLMPDAPKHVSAIATLGGATYSDFLGRGKRQFGNPYIGGRLGYAYLDGSRFVVQGEAGVELYKAKYVVLDANVRATGLLGSEGDFALVTGLGAVFAF